MKKLHLPVSAALAASVLLASTLAAKPTAKQDMRDMTLPYATKTVSPESISPRFLYETAKVGFMIDEHGRPENVHLIYPQDAELAAKLVPAIEQWKFEPATKDGVPVKQAVVLPVQLGDDA